MTVQDLDGLVEMVIVDMGRQHRAAAPDAFGVEMMVVRAPEQVLQHAPEAFALGHADPVMRIECGELVTNIRGRKRHVRFCNASMLQQTNRFVGVVAIIEERRDGVARHRTFLAGSVSRLALRGRKQSFAAAGSLSRRV